MLWTQWPVRTAALMLLAITLEPAVATAAVPPRRDFTFLWGVSTRREALPDQLTLEGNIYNLNHSPVSRNCRFLYSNDVGIFPEAGPHQVMLEDGYMETHLTDIRRDIATRIPDPKFDGPAIIDYEAWYLNWERTGNTPSTGGPLDHDRDFRQDWEDYVREHRPQLIAGLSDEDAAVAIQTSYEQAAMDFYIATIQECKRIRPKAQWGFYNYPPKRYLSNETPRGTIAYGNGGQHQASRLNDRLSRLWDASDALYPSTYANRVTVADGVEPDTTRRENSIADDRFYIRSIIRESQRLARGKPVYTVVWSRYQNSGDASQTPINELNVRNQCEVALETGANGLVWWDGIEFRAEYSELNAWMNTLVIPAMEDVIATRPGPPVPPGGGTPPGHEIGHVVQRPGVGPAILGNSVVADQLPDTAVSAAVPPPPSPSAPSPASVPIPGSAPAVPLPGFALLPQIADAAAPADPLPDPAADPAATGAVHFPGCACDWNRSDVIDAQDLLDYIEAYLAGDADFSGDGATDSQDFFAFQDCFFAAGD